MINLTDKEIYASKITTFKLTEYKVVISFLILYLFLCPFEFALNNAGGSFLKYWGMLIVLCSLAGLYKTNKKIRIEKEHFLLALWVLLGFVSLFWTEGFSNGLYYVLSSGNMVLIITILSFLKFNQISKTKLLMSVQFSCFIFSILMILKGNLYHSQGIRFTLFLLGKEADPNNIAGFLIPGLLISFSNILLHGKYKLHNLIIFSTIFVAVCLGGSRGGVTACILSLIVLISGNSKNKKNLIKNALLISITIIVIYYLSKTFISQSLLERLNPFNYGNDGGSDRIYLWMYGWNMICKNPIIGYGIGSYNTITGLGMHNTYLLIWFETGIFGLMFFVSSMYMFAKKLYKMKEYLGLSILIGGLVCIFFLDAYQKKFLWTNILLCTIILKSRKE